MSTALLDRRAPAGTLFRLATAGSVDDGKSTLVGRLLHDSKAVLADQLEAEGGLPEDDLPPEVPAEAAQSSNCRSGGGTVGAPRPEDDEEQVDYGSE